MKKLSWLDRLVYQVFCWYWGRILQRRPDLREIFLSWLKSYDVVDDNAPVKVVVTVAIEKVTTD